MEALRTPLCVELGIDYPIFSAGMGFGAGPELVAAVSSAGGFGVLGGGAPAEETRRRIARVRERTERPFGANVIVVALEHPDASDEDTAWVREEIAAVIEAARRRARPLLGRSVSFR